MEKYSKAVSEMYSQFKKREAHPLEKYIGRLAEPGDMVAEETPKHKTIGELIKEHEGVRGIQFSTDAHGNVQAAYIRGKHGGVKLVSMGDGLEDVSSKI